MISVHLTNTKNIGDEMCSPAHFLDGFSGRYNVRDALPDSRVTVWGGGCIASSANKLARERAGINIAFGVGTTKNDGSRVPPAAEIDGFDLAGIRDWPPKNGAAWVPCASALSPLFDNVPAPTVKRVSYGHKLKSPMQQMNNDRMDFEAVIAHLASAEEIVTSSYHGMVWGTLLGRKVFVEPFGAKFYGWPFEWGVRHDYALSLCRTAINDFWGKVQKL